MIPPETILTMPLLAPDEAARLLRPRCIGPGQYRFPGVIDRTGRALLVGCGVAAVATATALLAGRVNLMIALVVFAVCVAFAAQMIVQLKMFQTMALTLTEDSVVMVRSLGSWALKQRSVRYRDVELVAIGRDHLAVTWNSAGPVARDQFHLRLQATSVVTYKGEVRDLRAGQWLRIGVPELAAVASMIVYRLAPKHHAQPVSIPVDTETE